MDANTGGRLRAERGDRIAVRGHRVGEPMRDAEVLEARGPGGTAPFLVRWGDDGHEALFFPGVDAFVEHAEHGSKSGHDEPHGDG